MTEQIEYAVNLADLSRSEMQFIAGILLGPVIKGRNCVDAEPGRADGAAVVLECEQERAEAIIDTLRTGFKARAWPKPRAYKSKNGGKWRRVP